MQHLVRRLSTRTPITMADDEQFYATVADEIERGQIDKVLWTKALAHSGGETTRMPIDNTDEVNKRLSSMVEAVRLARESKDTTQVEARFQDLRAYCDEQMRVHKSVVFPLRLAAASSDMDQQIGFIEQAVVVSRQTGEKLHRYLYRWGVLLLGQGRLDGARKWLVEARDTATASGEEIIVTNATELLDFINRA